MEGLDCAVTAPCLSPRKAYKCLGWFDSEASSRALTVIVDHCSLWRILALLRPSLAGWSAHVTRFADGVGRQELRRCKEEDGGVVVSLSNQPGRDPCWGSGCFDLGSIAKRRKWRFWRWSCIASIWIDDQLMNFSCRFSKIVGCATISYVQKLTREWNFASIQHGLTTHCQSSENHPLGLSTPYAIESTPPLC